MHLPNTLLTMYQRPLKLIPVKNYFKNTAFWDPGPNVEIWPQTPNFWFILIFFLFFHIPHDNALLISHKWSPKVISLPKYPVECLFWRFFFTLFLGRKSHNGRHFFLFLNEVLLMVQSPFTELKNIEKQQKYPHLHMTCYKKWLKWAYRKLKQLWLYYTGKTLFCLYFT